MMVVLCCGVVDGGVVGLLMMVVLCCGVVNDGGLVLWGC